MPRFLLDTNILSDAVRNPHGNVANRIRRLGDRELCTSIIVAAEVRYGMAKSGRHRLTERVADLFRMLPVMALEPPVDMIYGDFRADLERRGIGIGANDLWIAAHTLTLGLVLVTANEREFSRIPGLAIENWLRPGRN
jgi:tRNA(fMet)-specific endonuclease VapC